MAIAVYPGTFDPITRGMKTSRGAPRASSTVVVGSSGQPAKATLSLEERRDVAREVLKRSVT